MVERKTEGLLVFVSDPDSLLFRELVILAGFRVVWPRFCRAQTPVSSVIFSETSGSRARIEGISDSENRDLDPTTLLRRQQGCRLAEERKVHRARERLSRAACSSFLDCRL